MDFDLDEEEASDVAGDVDLDAEALGSEDGSSSM